MSNLEVSVDLEFTPNPNSLKYVVDPKFFEKGVLNFKDKASINGRSLLAEELFELQDISSIMIGSNFVTVSILTHDRLTELNDEVIETIKKFVQSDKKAVEASALESSGKSNQANRTEVEKKIIDILDKEIRPSVAMDGGDISFDRYEDGILYLLMQGACAGCPSSSATLKMGIESRLKQEIPDLIEVISV